MKLSSLVVFMARFRSEELKQEQIAQIQQILVDQLGADPNKLSITEKR